MNKAAMICLQIGVLIVLVTGGVLVGYQSGMSNVEEEVKSSYDYGVTIGRASSSAKDDLKESKAAYADLLKQHNTLVDDYNKLRETAINAVGAAANQSMHCTSYDYGINDQFTSTNCY